GLAAIGVGNVAVSGGPGNYTLTFQGILANSPEPLTTINSAGLTAGATNTTTQQGSNGNEVQALTFTAGAGTFFLSFANQTTGALAFNATASTVQAALQALSAIGAGNVSVTGSPGNYTLTFQGALANTDVPQTTITLLTGLTAGAITTQVTA